MKKRWFGAQRTNTVTGAELLRHTRRAPVKWIRSIAGYKWKNPTLPSTRNSRLSPRNAGPFSKSAAAIGAYAALSAYYRFRPEPQGISPPPRMYRVPADDLHFYHDTTWNANGERQSNRGIAGEVIWTIRRARRFVLMDIFLFNLHHIRDDGFVPTTRQIADTFRGKRHSSLFITDPLNTAYGSNVTEPLVWLEEAGVRVCTTNLDRIRDNNLLYAPLWHLLVQPFGAGGRGWLSHPLREGHTITLRAYLTALTLRANHRKVVIADREDTWRTIVTSSNFEDSSSYFGNVALAIDHPAVAMHFFEAEKAVARMSACEVPFSMPEFEDSSVGERESDEMAEVTPLMGTHIKKVLLDDLSSADAGDELSVFALFLGERDVIDSLVRAARRGVAIRILLDPNLVSFGEKKDGFPNQIVAAELSRRANVAIRWANVERDEYHTKLVVIRKKSGCIIHLGSANLTRRSLSGTNLEANVRVAARADARVCRDILGYAEQMWRSPYSVAFRGGDPSVLKYGWYRIQEAIGIATF